MKKSLMNIARTLSLLASAGALAQQPDAVDLEDVDARRPLEGYSQSASLSAAPSLDLIAINKPDAFAGLEIVDTEGKEIGRIESIARLKQDNSLHAVVANTSGLQSAIRLDALALDALAFWAPGNALVNESFTEAEFEPVTQYQSGHTAWGSLRQPADAPDTDQRSQPAPLPGPVVNPIEAQQQALADQAAQHSRSGHTETPVAVNQQQVYETSNSPIVLLALNQSEALHGMQLLAADGRPLGEIASIAKKISDQELYAVLMRTDATEPSAVKLDALTVGRLMYDKGEAGFVQQSYDADDFEALAR